MTQRELITSYMYRVRQ